jgi:hypothetical protein
MVAMTAGKVYTVTAERGAGQWWVLECAELGAVSQVRRLSDAKEEMREALAYLADVAPDSFDIDVRPIVSDDVAALMIAAAEHRTRASTEQKQAADALRAAARAMHERGLTYRDVAVVMGLSYQRVAQLVA